MQFSMLLFLQSIFTNSSNIGQLQFSFLTCLSVPQFFSLFLSFPLEHSCKTKEQNPVYNYRKESIESFINRLDNNLEFKLYIG